MDDIREHHLVEMSVDESIVSDTLGYVEHQNPVSPLKCRRNPASDVDALHYPIVGAGRLFDQLKVRDLRLRLRSALRGSFSPMLLRRECVLS